MIITAAALAAVSAFGQSTPVKPATGGPEKAPATATAPASADPVVISAGTTQIHKSEFEQAVRSLPQEYQNVAKGPGRRQFAEDYLRMKMLSSEGMRRGLDKDPDVAAQIDLMKENLVANATLHKIEGGIVVADADLKKAYDENKKEYEQVKARHILVAFKGSPAARKQEGKPELTEEQAKAKAEELRTKILGGADFAELAKKESDDPGSGANGGDLGSFGHGQMVPEFETAAFGAKTGEIPPVVRTQFGYHVIKVESKETTPFEQVKASLERDVKQKKVQEAIDALKNNAKATFDEAYFAPPEPPAAQAAPAPMSKDPKSTAAPKDGKPATPASKDSKPATKKP